MSEITRYATEEYVNEKTKTDDGNETLDKLLSYGLVSDVLMLDDGTYLADENGKVLQL